MASVVDSTHAPSLWLYMKTQHTLAGLSSICGHDVQHLLPRLRFLHFANTVLFTYFVITTWSFVSFGNGGIRSLEESQSTFTTQIFITALLSLFYDRILMWIVLSATESTNQNRASNEKFFTYYCGIGSALFLLIGSIIWGSTPNSDGEEDGNTASYIIATFVTATVTTWAVMLVLAIMKYVVCDTWCCTRSWDKSHLEASTAIVSEMKAVEEGVYTPQSPQSWHHQRNVQYSPTYERKTLAVGPHTSTSYDGGALSSGRPNSNCGTDLVGREERSSTVESSESGLTSNATNEYGRSDSVDEHSQQITVVIPENVATATSNGMQAPVPNSSRAHNSSGAARNKKEVEDDADEDVESVDSGLGYDTDTSSDASEHVTVKTANALVEDADFNRLYQYEEENDPHNWKSIVKKKDIQVYMRKNDSTSSVHLVKAYVHLKGIMREVAQHLLLDMEGRPKWDPLFSDARVVGKVSPTNDCIYFAIKAPPGVTNRDFVQFRSARFDKEGNAYICYKNGDHPSVPENPDMIRAHTVLAGYVIRLDEEDPQSCWLTAFSQNDVRGFIPKAMQNMFAPKATERWCKSFCKTCVKLQSDQATLRKILSEAEKEKRQAREEESIRGEMKRRRQRRRPSKSTDVDKATRQTAGEDKNRTVATKHNVGSSVRSAKANSASPSVGRRPMEPNRRKRSVRSAAGQRSRDGDGIDVELADSFHQVYLEVKMQLSKDPTVVLNSYVTSRDLLRVAQRTKLPQDRWRAFVQDKLTTRMDGSPGDDGGNTSYRSAGW